MTPFCRAVCRSGRRELNPASQTRSQDGIRQEYLWVPVEEGSPARRKRVCGSVGQAPLCSPWELLLLADTGSVSDVGILQGTVELPREVL